MNFSCQCFSALLMDVIVGFSDCHEVWVFYCYYYYTLCRNKPDPYDFFGITLPKCFNVNII